MKPKTRNTPALRFPEFNDEWHYESLEQIFSVSSGTTPSRANPQYFQDAEHHWVKTTDLNNAEIFETEERVSDLALEQTSLKKYPCGTVLIAMYGGFHQIGRTGLLRVEAAINQALVALPPVSERVDPYFLLSFLNRNVRSWRRVAASSRKDPNLTKNDVAKFRFVFPTLKEQQKIASFLAAVDEKIGLLARKKELLLKYKKGVMQQLFDQKIRFKDETGNKFQAWKDTPLGKFLIPTLRETETPSEPYLAIGLRSHFKGTFQKPDSDPEQIEMDKLFIVRTGDLIVNITFAWEGALAIAKKEDDGGLVSHRFPTYRFDEKITSAEFFKYIYSSAKFKHLLKLVSPGGAGRNRVLNKKDFLGLKVLLPSVPEQKRITGFLQALDLKIDSVGSQLENTKTYKRGLLQQMFV